jgi:RNA polymerase sigma-54 factor
MALEIKQHLKLSQQLVITPQLQQAIKLLQLSRMELQNLIQQELVENPVLEESEEREREEQTGSIDDDRTRDAKEGAPEQDTTEEVGTKEGEMREPTDFDWENYIGIYNSPYPAGAPPTPASEAPSFENMIGATESLQDHLFWQLHLSEFTEAQLHIAEEIIGNINDDGYLSTTVAELGETCSVDAAAVEACLRQVQGFDPAGVGARDLQECLLIQARQMGGRDQALLEQIISNHMHELERHHHSPIAKKLKVPYERARELVSIIHNMEPKPGRPYSGENAQYITPDVYIVKMGDEFEVFLNEDGLPKLQVSNFYRRALSKEANIKAEAKEFLQGKLRSAMWLIKSIHQRQRTLYKVTKSIIKFQHDFFDKGINYLRPMVLRDVAEDIQMHESTVSRVTTSKYAHTPRGIFELKFFFNSSVQKNEGADIASESVRNRIHQLIAGENPRRPLSDQKIAKLLQAEDIMIARRTVAKYRETLTIPPSSQRRRMED